MSLKCDLNPVYRRKGALLWPPLHPSPHFHPPCLGRRTKVPKRLSTSSPGPHLVGCSKSTRSPLPFLPLPPPSPFSVFLCSAPCLPCCMSHPSTSCPHHQTPAFISIILIARLNNWNCVVLWRQNLRLTAERWAESWRLRCSTCWFECFLCSRNTCNRKQPPVCEKKNKLSVKCIFYSSLRC